MELSVKPSKVTISGKANIIIKHNDVKECRLRDDLHYLSLDKLVGLNNAAPKSATLYVGKEIVSYYSTPSGVLFPDGNSQSLFHIPTQLVNIRLELNAREFTAEELLKIEMVLSVLHTQNVKKNIVKTAIIKKVQWFCEILTERKNIAQ